MLLLLQLQLRYTKVKHILKPFGLLFVPEITWHQRLAILLEGTPALMLLWIDNFEDHIMFCANRIP